MRDRPPKSSLRAPTLYLDSNDISRFADGRPEYLAVERCILDAVHEGVITCRFSVVHVEEALHTAPEHRSHALRRAEALVRLCGRSCLLFWHDLVMMEAIAVVADLPLALEAAQRDDGLWAPVPDLDPAELEASMRERRDETRHEIRALLAQHGLSRQQRRRLERRAMAGRLPTSPARGKCLPLDDVPEGLRQVMAGMDSRSLLDWAFGQGGTGRVARDLKSLVLDLPAFVGHHFDGFPVLQEQFRILRRTGATIRAGVEQGRAVAARMADIDKAAARGLVDDLVKGFVTATRAKLLDGLGASGRNALRAQRLPEGAWDEKVMCSPPGSLPALDTLVQAMAAHLRRSMLPGANRRLLDSDFADMFHALYLPYVDAFRCDANAAQVLAPIAARHGVALLSRLEEVPGWIEAQRAACERGAGPSPIAPGPPTPGC